MKVLILDNYDSFTYNLAQLIEESDCKRLTLDIAYSDQITLEKVANYDKILLSPGPGLPAEAGITCALIQHYAAQKPILGVCLGHQAIAYSFGGSLYNLPYVRHGLGQEIQISWQNTYLFRNLRPKLKVGLYHSWAVSPENFPPSLEITALSEEGIIMALQHQQYDLQGIQFHPESILTEQGQTIINNWLRQ